MLNINQILDKLKELKGFKTDTELASALGVAQNTVSTWRKRGAMSYDEVIAFCDKEGFDLDFVIFGRGGLFEHDVVNIPVYAMAGAGTPKELFEGEPLGTIPVARKKYKPGLTALIVAGESMEPTLRDGAEVLVDREDIDLVEGKIYVVYIKDSGIVLKRVNRAVDAIILTSDNPKSPPIKARPEDIIIQGKIVGVSQGL